MCGIAGIRRYGDSRITPEEVNILLARLEHRGNHATGIALMVNKEVKVIKAPKPAWSFIADKDTMEFLDVFLKDATMAILHTRFATIGNPEDNENNHPMFAGRAAVVHNGGISNHQWMMDQIHAKRSCATDSDIFRAILDSDGMTETAIKNMNRLVGSAAIAAMSQDDPDVLILARSGSPLVYGTAPDKLWWASELQAIQMAVRPWTAHHGLQARKSRGDISYFCMPDNTAYILTSKGLDRRFEFKTSYHYNAPTYAVHSNYYDKMSGWKREKKATRRLVAGTSTPQMTHKSTKCPKVNCSTSVVIPRDQKWANFICPDCKTPLKALDSLTDTDFIYQENPEVQ